MNLIKILTAICSLLLLSVGADKFLNFLEPPCSLMESIPTMLWKILGIVQMAGGVLLWIPKYRKYVAGFFVLFILTFTLIHLFSGTYDIGGSSFVGLLLALLLWEPSFLKGKKNVLKS